jgi:hypothetical protein
MLISMRCYRRNAVMRCIHLALLCFYEGFLIELPILTI